MVWVAPERPESTGRQNLLTIDHEGGDADDDIGNSPPAQSCDETLQRPLIDNCTRRQDCGNGDQQPK